MEVNIIQKADFGPKGPFARLDAEYVWKSWWDVEKVVRGIDGWPLIELVSEYNGPTLNDGFCSEDAVVGYVDIDSIDTADGLAYADDLLYGDRPSRAKYQLRESDLLVSNVRPNRGAISLVGTLRAGALASSGFSLLRDKELKNAPQAYLFAFLKSSFGRTQMKRRCRGSMYPAVSFDDLLDVWVPKPPDKLLYNVCESVKRGVSLQTRFFQLVEKQAQVLGDFLAPFGHPPSPLDGDVTKANWTQIEKSDVDGAERFDAEFFRHEYGTFDKKLQSSSPTFLLRDYYKLSPGRGLGNGNELIPFVKQGVLTNAGVNWSAVSYEQGTVKPFGDVRAGDILLACTAHEVYYVGRKVDFVRDVPEKIRKMNAAVADLMVIRSRPEKPEGLYGSFIAAFLRSPAGLHQVQRCIRGLRGGHVYKDDLSRYVRVPLPKQPWLDAFEERASDYESVRAEAKREIGSACGTVEEWLSREVHLNL
ncbi:MAG: hypothetical protein LAN70_12385 [Acidobacteriia bacterium]|nr:hypothetical protein [Terriglobia bacterium]